MAEFVGGHVVDVGDGDGTDCLADELDVLVLDVLDHHDALLGQEMQRQLVRGVLQD